jgi:hypothetical protein
MLSLPTSGSLMKSIISVFFVKFSEICFLGPCKDSMDNNCQKKKLNGFAQYVDTVQGNGESGLQWPYLPPRKLLARELLGQYSFFPWTCATPWSIWPGFVHLQLLAKHCARCVEKGLTVPFFSGIEVLMIL